MLTCKHDLKWKILYFMTCASVNVTYIGPIHLSFNIIKFKSACILNYKFRWSDILFSLEFCFSGLFQGLSRLNQDFFRTILGMTIFQDSTRLNQDFSGHFSAAGTLKELRPFLWIGGKHLTSNFALGAGLFGPFTLSALGFF